VLASSYISIKDYKSAADAFEKDMRVCEETNHHEWVISSAKNLENCRKKLNERYDEILKKYNLNEDKI
jgi:hypothetical protein